MMAIALEDWLNIIKLHGSVRNAAKSQGLSVEAVSKRFRKLPEDNPIKQQYELLVKETKCKRKAKKYPDRTTGDRIRQQRHREKRANS